MRILFLGLNYAPEEIGCAVYSAGLCEALAAMGHSVHVVTTKPYYPAWFVPRSYRGGWRRERMEGVAVIRCPIYVPRSPTGMRRIAHHLSFAASCLLPMVWSAIRRRPDIVVTVAPSLLAAPVARLAAVVARAPAWLHVQDFEVEAAFATGLIDQRSRIARMARGIQKTIIRQFDRVSSISEEMCAKLVAFVPRDRIVEFRNWADLDAAARPSGDDYRTEWAIGDRKVALYSGNLANKQGIEIILSAAKLLAHRSDLLFVICGEGPTRKRLENDSRDLPNVLIYDLQPKDRLDALLALARVHLLPQQAGAADLVLPSKLTNMLASGRPVLATASPGTGLAREIEGAGIAVTPGDSNGFANAIVKLIDDERLWMGMAHAARERAATRWNRATIIGEFASRLVDLDRLRVRVGRAG